MTNCDCIFEVGDTVTFPGGSGEISKIDHRETGACLVYIHTEDGLVKRPSSLGLEKVDTTGERLASGQFDDADRFDLRVKAAELGLAHRQDRFVALNGSRIDIEPYQVEAAYRILNSLEHRYLIGDEVGLGKTIEAAIVIEELIARDRADRVLIVTPAPLAVQWQEEMREKFDREYIVYDRDYVSAKRKAYPNKNVWTHDDRIITSIDFAKQDDMRAALENLEEEWDIAVFDEAHHLTARRKGDNTKETTDRYKVGRAVATNSDGLLFLTGTPHKGKPDQFYYLMSLLDPYRFRSEADITPDSLKDLMIRRLKDDMYEPDGSRMFPEKNIETLPVNFTDEERELYEAVTDYISENYNLAKREDNSTVGFAMAIYQKRLVSSIHAIRESLKKRRETIKAGGKDLSELSQLVRSLLDKYRTDPDMLTDAQRERVEEELGQVTLSTGSGGAIQKELQIVNDLYNQAKQIQTDSKAQRLREYIEGMLDQDPDEKVLVFTEYTDTLEYLRDQVLRDHDVAQIYGDLGQDHRRKELEKFRNDANIMLATDAAREGLNLQFAHIMVNYDLPWNPTRIDQRIGRLHRYGQEHTVEIRNLFVNDTRESEILEVLMEKLEEIESTLGMSSDVLGMVLDEFDLEGQIMTAIAKQQSTEQFEEVVEKTVEEHEEAIQRIEDDFLIRDRFDLSDKDRQILDVIKRSREEGVSETDVESLVRAFLDEFGGKVKGSHPGPSREDGDVFQLVVPDAIAGGEVKKRYDRVTFSRDIAKDDDDITFIALEHPLVQNIIEFCLQTDLVGGQVAVKTGSEATPTPGLLCNYRLGYQSGRGDTVAERLVQIYVQEDGTVMTDGFEQTGGLPADKAGAFDGVATVAQNAESLLMRAEDKAWELISNQAEEAEAERKREVEIKRKHAERYFDNRIEELEERLEGYEKRADDPEDNVQVLINKTTRELSDIRKERESEFTRLDEEETVFPAEPELVNAAVVVGL